MMQGMSGLVKQLILIWRRMEVNEEGHDYVLMGVCLWIQKSTSPSNLDNSTLYIIIVD